MRKEFAERVTLVMESEVAERLWCVIHSDQGPFAVCSWYRPPARGETASIDSFASEWDEISELCVGTIAIGDFNVHSKRWLRWSTGESTEGTALDQASRKLGSRQIEKELTREGNLLDLVLTDVEGVQASVRPGVSDHSIVIASMKLTIPESEVVERQVWQYRDADWAALTDRLSEADWSFIESVDTSTATKQMTEKILTEMHACIPQRVLAQTKSSHPWLTDRAVEAVKRKHDAAGTHMAQEASYVCSAIMLEERESFRARTCSKLRDLPAGSKQWWTKSKVLMEKKTSATCIPALKTSTGSWVMDPVGRANHFCEVFAKKSKLITEEKGAFSSLEVTGCMQCALVTPDEDRACRQLKDLNEGSATGPDLVPTKVLRTCASALAKPVAALLRRIVQTGQWPELWRIHWIVPLY